MPSLILIKSPGGMAVPQTFQLQGTAPGKCIIGRQRDACDIIIDDGHQQVSRQHAVITQDSGRYFFEDMSRNGTLLNNQRVDKQSGKLPIKHEDRLKIADFLFRFHDERAAAPVPLPQNFLSQLPDPDHNEDASTVHHTIHRNSAQQFLDVQPSDRLRVLLEISTTLARSLDLDTLMPQIADTLFGVFKQADRCFVIQLDDAGRPYTKIFRSRRLKADDRFSRTIVRRCMETMSAYLSEDASSDHNMGAAQSIAEFRIRSVMCVPLATTNGTSIGALQLDTQDIMKKFREDDLKLLTIVANLASVSVEKAQVHATLLQREKVQREIELAKQVQLGFLPQHPPTVSGYEFFNFYSAAQTVGGDYFDYIHLPDGRLAVLLGDVAGKGVAASLLMAKLSAESRFCVLTQSCPMKAIGLLNELLFKGGIGDRFVTLVAAILDPKTHQITIVNAGHMTPFRYRLAVTEFAECVTTDEIGFPLGVMDSTEYVASTFTLEQGDSLVLFTDGVTDALSPSGEMFEFAGLRIAGLGDSVLSANPRPKALGERIISAVRKHANGRAQNDDIALVCFGRVENPSSMGPSTGSGVLAASPRIVA